MLTPTKIVKIFQNNLKSGAVDTSSDQVNLTTLFMSSGSPTYTLKEPVPTWLDVSRTGDALTVSLKDDPNVPYSANVITVSAIDDTVTTAKTNTITVWRNRKPRLKGAMPDPLIFTVANGDARTLGELAIDIRST